MPAICREIRRLNFIEAIDVCLHNSERLVTLFFVIIGDHQSQNPL